MDIGTLNKKLIQIEELKVVDYIIINSDKEIVHTTINGKGRIARLMENNNSRKSNKKYVR